MEKESQVANRPTAADAPVLDAPHVEVPRTDTQRPTTLFIGVTGVVDLAQLRLLAGAVAASGLFGSAHLTIAYPGPEAGRSAVAGNCDLLAYPLPTAEGTSSPWAHTAAAETAMLVLATDEQAQVVVFLHADLGAMEPATLAKLVSPVLAREADLVMASYRRGPYDSLVNSSLLAPLTRALYGKHVRFPLAPDMAMSSRVAARLRMRAHSTSSTAAPTVLWPTVVAASMDAPVTEVELGVQHPAARGEVELATVLSQLVGSTFAEMEAHAPLWQRVRASAPPAPRAGDSFASGGAPLDPIDTAPMIKTFLLGTRSLQDVWGMVVPPVTLLDLKRVTLMAPDKLRIPDELWVRIVYDFALGYRLRTINRAHLMGALTPLYLGWVASYVNEVSSDPGFNVEARFEQLARAFEEGKPYLVRRWRWPDRFNP